MVQTLPTFQWSASANADWQATAQMLSAGSISKGNMEISVPGRACAVNVVIIHCYFPVLRRQHYYKSTSISLRLTIAATQTGLKPTPRLSTLKPSIPEAAPRSVLQQISRINAQGTTRATSFSRLQIG
ncbi:uncharacterized protein Z520_12163 [Fonsecaea multimorphosa CBS 102226]|uniref:Uncharacterized protein n=1 Tax=Fonsecaea multimorphosa CBS 102226 TaxID=1442371 RepID=A0A0D2GRM2_9EURO|nr:uncharacterized protein Z520_12163 [Fonsecaea multimorphosa CBS 102226]KIX92170.1 hypothetical protein Z520_12163 [Fonsecaea multimorphosa CBS 102226]